MPGHVGLPVLKGFRDMHAGRRISAALCLALLLASPAWDAGAASLVIAPFGTTLDGKPVIHDKDEQLAIADGYDQYWVLNKQGDPAQPQLAVHAYDPESGRTLDCWTTEPGVQICTASYSDGSYSGTGGRYGKYAAFTLETHHFPDSPNHPAFPMTELRPGQVYDSTTTFRFGVQR